MSTRTIWQDQRRAGSALAFLLCTSIAVIILTFLFRPGLLDVAYFVLTVGIGFWLFSAGSAWFFGWMWLLFFFSPFFRRVIDYVLNTYSSPPLVLLSSLTVAFISSITLFRYGKRLAEPMFRPHLMALVVIGYGYLLALATRGLVTATEELLKWLVPILLSFHLLIFWRLYPTYREVTRTAFTVGVALMGLYGIYQYFYLPGWGINTMINSEMASIGAPRAREARVFSTLNSPGPFGMIMMVGLLFLFDRQSWISLLVAVPGYAGWALASVRASWVGWVFGMGLLLYGLRGKQRVRLAALAGAVMLICTPFFGYLAITERFVNRATTLVDVQQDGSFQGRAGQYSDIATVLINNPIGNGLGSIYYDSGIVTAFHQLGFLGLVYLAALGLMLWRAWRSAQDQDDTFVTFAWAVGTTMGFLLLAGSQQIGVAGCAMWGFVSLAIAGRMYNDEEGLG
ncbi:MAG: hypothetical protein AAF970_08485 [Bacteroidota bacterium]